MASATQFMNDWKDVTAIFYGDVNRKAVIYDNKKLAITSICVTIITWMTLLIIASIATTGIFSGYSIGWAVVGISLGKYAFQLLAGNLKNRGSELIYHALKVTALLIIGTLGGLGVLTGVQVGWCTIGILLTPNLFACIKLGDSCCRLSRNDRGDRFYAMGRDINPVLEYFDDPD